jgi:hypothetical protein
MKIARAVVQPSPFGERGLPPAHRQGIAPGGK